LIGTPCRPAAGSCDVAEVCTGLSSTCPSDITVPDTTPCNDANTCTTSDACLGGVCVGTPDPTSCVDHFLCYKTRQPSAPYNNATLVDSFDGSVAATVKKARYLCTPAENDGGPVLDNVTHLKAYKFRQTPTHVRETNLLVTNDSFGSIRLDTTRPDLLYVPAAKSLVTQPLPPDNNLHNVDHYKCYKVRVTRGTPKFAKGQTASVGDQFTTPKNFNVKKPRHLCTPVDKNGEGIETPGAHLLCYKVSVVRGQPKHTGQNTFVTDHGRYAS